MKTFFLTLSMVLGTVALFAQGGPMTVFNGSLVPITVDMGVTDPNCGNFGTASTLAPILPGTFASIAPLINNATYSWYNIRAVEVTGGGLGTAPASSTSHNKCMTSCPTPVPVNNGLTTFWDPGSNCFRIIVN